MIIKFLITVLIIINLRPPLVSLLDIILICILLLLLISSKSTFKLKQIIYKKYKLLLFILFITIINLSLPKNKIEEAHSIFINNNDIEIISKFLPSSIIDELQSSLNNFDIKRLLKSDNTYFNTIEKYRNATTIKNPYAFSADSFFQNNKYSRQVDSINFSSREDLRIGQLNTTAYKLPFDKEFRRILPYYVLYEIPSIYKNSTICSKSNLYYYYSKKSINIQKINEIDFIKKNQNKKCIKLKEEFKKTYVLAFSINEKDNLSIKLKKNIILTVIDFFHYIIIFSLIIIFSVFLLKIKFNINSFIFLISVITTYLLALIRDQNLIYGFRYFRGGSDGLVHNSHAQKIIENLSNGNYLLALQGGSDVFYFMPGLRYFEAFSKIFFGDTNYAYLLITTLLPLSLFIFFKKYLNKKYAIILFISFIFLPIFENMGFGYFNYIWQVARNHAETLSITLIIISLTYIINIENNFNQINDEKITILFIGIFLAIAAISRPNFFPTTAILCFYTSIIYFLNKNYTKSFLILIGFSLVFFCLFHNVYFGKTYKFFTNTEMHFIFNTAFLKYNSQINNSNLILSQLLLWNPLYNIHRFIFLIVIIYFIIIRKQSFFTYTLFTCVITQHIVLLLTHPSSRYAYLAWLLTFILFIKIENQNNIFKSLYISTKKLIK